MWASGDHHPGAIHDLPGHFQPSWLSPEEVAAAVPADGKRPLMGGTILEETLWSCTTCGACMDQCPVLIEHVPKIMDMRRHLVLDESTPAEAGGVGAAQHRERRQPVWAFASVPR